MTLVPKGEMYFLELHDDTQYTEVATTTFSDFRPSGVTSDGMTLLSSYGNFDEDAPPENPEFVKMVLRRTNSKGEGNNREVNYGEWMLTLTGKGDKNDIITRYIVGAREPAFWGSTDAMVFRGYSEQERTQSANQP